MNPRRCVLPARNDNFVNRQARSSRGRRDTPEVAVKVRNKLQDPSQQRARKPGIAIWVIALEALRGHKLRSFLTLLGVVVATSTLIVVMSVVNGMNLYIAEHIANLGTNTFVLHQFQWAQGFDSFLTARRRNKPIRV